MPPDAARAPASAGIPEQEVGPQRQRRADNRPDDPRPLVHGRHGEHPYGQKASAQGAGKGHQQGRGEAPPPGYGWDTSILLYKNHELVPSLANLFHILRNDPNWAGVLAYNKFAYQVMKLKPPPFEGGEVGEWNEEDDANTAIWLSNRYRFSPTAALTGDAVEVVSKHSAFHPVQDYLTALVWDGTERLDNWITEYIGAPKK